MYRYLAVTLLLSASMDPFTDEMMASRLRF